MYEWIILFLKYIIGFFLLIAMLEGFLNLRIYLMGLPTMFIVRIGNRASFLKDDGGETNSHADGVSFSFLDPKRYIFLKDVNRHVEKWEFRKLHSLNTSVANSSKLKAKRKEKKKNDKI